MEIIYKNPKELKDYSNNPRNNTTAIEPVIESIKMFGFLVPILIDHNNEIIAGHTRKAAAVRLEFNEIPCICVEELTEEEIKAFRLVDNKTSELASWDFEKLEEELNSIIDLDLSEFHFPELGGELLVSDEDFLQDTENMKEKKEKVITCPKCGAEIAI